MIPTYGFGDLRVINKDQVNPGAGFPTHSHLDMEIITYVLEGGWRAGTAPALVHSLK
jgi:redox-sensitive bicupin YhaK (pirin superfamily)